MLDLVAKRFAEARERLNEAITWQRKALTANPAHPVYREHLTGFLRILIEAAGGLGDAQTVAEAERPLKELAESDPVIQALDAKLAQVAAGQDAPNDEAERLRLAVRAYEKGRYLLSTRLWREALEANPKLGDDRQAQHRYNASCAAALAAAGEGKDEPPPDDAEKARLRKQALEWLNRELAAWNKFLANATPNQRAQAARILNHWRNADPDLTGIRDKEALAKLPEAERAEWDAFWTSVDAALEKARGE